MCNNTYNDIRNMIHMTYISPWIIFHIGYLLLLCNLLNIIPSLTYYLLHVILYLLVILYYYNILYMHHYFYQHYHWGQLGCPNRLYRHGPLTTRQPGQLGNHRIKKCWYVVIILRYFPIIVCILFVF